MSNESDRAPVERDDSAAGNPHSASPAKVTDGMFYVMVPGPRFEAHGVADARDAEISVLSKETSDGIERSPENP